MSEGTADELSHYVTDISFIGNGAPEEVAKHYQTITKPHTSTCFIRAKNSVDSVRSLINRDQDFSLPVYHNSIIEEIPNGEFDILIFTSPMNVEAWFGKRSHSQEQIIAIGHTTAKKLKEYNILDVTVSNQPSEMGMAESLHTLI